MNSIYHAEEWLSPDDFAKRINIAPNTVRKLIRDGEIPAKKFGNRWRINTAILVIDN